MLISRLRIYHFLDESVLEYFVPLLVKTHQRGATLVALDGESSFEGPQRFLIVIEIDGDVPVLRNYLVLMACSFVGSVVLSSL